MGVGKGFFGVLSELIVGLEDTISTESPLPLFKTSGREGKFTYLLDRGDNFLQEDAISLQDGFKR